VNFGFVCFVFSEPHRDYSGGKREEHALFISMTLLLPLVRR